MHNKAWVLNTPQVDTMSFKDFRAAEKSWMPEQSRKMTTLRKIAAWKGKLAADESPAQSLARAQGYAEQVDLNDHALFLMETPTLPHPEEDAELEPNPETRSGRLFVWSYQKNRLICAAPPLWVEDPNKPDLKAALGELRALPNSAP